MQAASKTYRASSKPEKTITRGKNPWVEHVQRYRSANRCTFGEALRGARATYRGIKRNEECGKTESFLHFIAFKTASSSPSRASSKKERVFSLSFDGQTQSGEMHFILAYENEFGGRTRKRKCKNQVTIGSVIAQKLVEKFAYDSTTQLFGVPDWNINIVSTAGENLFNLSVKNVYGKFVPDRREEFKNYVDQLIGSRELSPYFKTNEIADKDTILHKFNTSFRPDM